MTRRYAIYYAPPPGSDLEAFGRRWLGRDHITGEPVDQPKVDGLDPTEQAEITRSARHYGFHATLKAPFELAAGRDAEKLYAKAQNFASAREKFEAPALQITKISKWVAFTLSGPSQSMDRLSVDCVRDFEEFRAPLSSAEIERRRKSGLTPRQDQQLLTFGYPHIFDDFHFHMTLAGPLEKAWQDRVHGLLSARAQRLKNIPSSSMPLRSTSKRAAIGLLSRRRGSRLAGSDRALDLVLEHGDEQAGRPVQIIGVNHLANVIAGYTIGIDLIQAPFYLLDGFTSPLDQPLAKDLVWRRD